MTNATDKAIIDMLLRHPGINLPEIGSLTVKPVPAEFINAKTIRPPHREIVFSKVQNSKYPSAESIRGYRQWLSEVKRNGDLLELNGIGALRSDTFYPSVELYEQLNPQGVGNVTVRKHHNIVLLAGLCVILIVCAVYVAMKFSGGGESEYLREAGLHDTTASNTAVQTAAADALPQTENTELTPPPVSEPDADMTEPVVTQSSVYHIVAGVFSSEENADKMIAADPLKIGPSEYHKIPFGKDRTIVGVYGSEDRQSAETRMRELRKTNGDLWIYEQKPAQR